MLFWSVPMWRGHEPDGGEGRGKSGRERSGRGNTHKGEGEVDREPHTCGAHRCKGY